MLGFGGKRRLGENCKLLQGHGATYHIISFQTVTCISKWQRSLFCSNLCWLFSRLQWRAFSKLASRMCTALGWVPSGADFPILRKPKPLFHPSVSGGHKKLLTFSIMFCEVSVVLFGWRFLMLASKFQAFYSFQTCIVCCKHNAKVWFVRWAFETIEKRGAFETVGENAPRELFQFKPWAFLIKSSLLFVFARRRVCK